MPLTENQMRLTAAGACLSKVSVIAGDENCFMHPVFISMTRNCDGFKVRITKYQLKRQIGLVLS